MGTVGAGERPATTRFVLWRDHGPDPGEEVNPGDLVREVRLIDEQYAAIRERTRSSEGIPRDTNRKRRTEIAKIREQARQRVPILIDDPLWVAGTILYWAEGAKTPGSLSMANADPRALRLFVAWVRTYLRKDAQFSLHLHLHEGNDEPAARAHWTNETGLADANFHRTFISRPERATGRTISSTGSAP